MATKGSEIGLAQCCRRGFDGRCATCTPRCSAGECVNRPGNCAMHCGCAQHGHEDAS